MHRFSRILLLTLLLVASSQGWSGERAAAPASPAASSSAPVALRISALYSNVGFSVTKWMVLKEEGQFRKLEGSISLNRSDLARSQVELTIDVNSIDTHGAGRDNVLRSDDFFDIQRYPTMSFKSTSLARTADPNIFNVTGDFTLHGITRRITVPVVFRGISDVPNAGTYAGFESDFTLDRTDYGVNGTRWSGGKLIISREVKVHMVIGASNREP